LQKIGKSFIIKPKAFDVYSAVKTFSEEELIWKRLKRISALVVCPQHLKIRELLEDVARKFEKKN
jgi:predicted aldo/keto reductase-like oxidoreductase